MYDVLEMCVKWKRMVESASGLGEGGGRWKMMGVYLHPSIGGIRRVIQMVSDISVPFNLPPGLEGENNITERSQHSHAKKGVCGKFFRPVLTEASARLCHGREVTCPLPRIFLYGRHLPTPRIQTVIHPQFRDTTQRYTLYRPSL